MTYHTMTSRRHLQEISEDAFLRVSPLLTKEWKKIALHLGFRWLSLAEFELDYSREEAVFRMFETWDKQTPVTEGKQKLEKCNKAITKGVLTHEHKPILPWESGDIHDDKFLYQICECLALGNLWKRLGEDLLSKSLVEHAEKNNPGNDVNAAMDILVKWRQQQTNPRKSFPTLVKAVGDAGASYQFVKKIKKNVRANPQMLITAEELVFLKDSQGEEILLGVGAYGRVVKGSYTGKDVAVKILFEGYTIKRDLKTVLVREAEIMRRVSNGNTVPLLGVLIDDKSKFYGLVMEYMPNGSLHDFLEVLDEPVSWLLKIQLTMDICRGLFHLHKWKLIHQDLKSSNIMIDKNFTARIGDFGQSCFCNITETTLKGLTLKKEGTITHMAPEVLHSENDDYSPKKASDVWSLGILMFQIAAEKLRAMKQQDQPFKRLPFPLGMKEQSVLIKVGWKKESPLNAEQEQQKLDDGCPDYYLRLIRQCLTVDYTQRPKVIDILKVLKAQFDEVDGELRTYEDIRSIKAKLRKKLARKSQSKELWSFESPTDGVDTFAGLHIYEDIDEEVGETYADMNGYTLALPPSDLLQKLETKTKQEERPPQDVVDKLPTNEVSAPVRKQGAPKQASKTTSSAIATDAAFDLDSCFSEHPDYLTVLAPTEELAKKDEASDAIANDTITAHGNGQQHHYENCQNVSPPLPPKLPRKNGMSKDNMGQQGDVKRATDERRKSTPPTTPKPHVKIPPGDLATVSIQEHPRGDVQQLPVQKFPQTGIAPVSVQEIEPDMLFGATSAAFRNTKHMIKSVILNKSIAAVEKTSTSTEECHREGLALLTVQHPNIVQLLGICSRKPPGSVITKLMPNRDLFTVLQKEFEVGWLEIWAQQILSGLEFVESKKFVHRGVRAANVLLDADFMCVISGFSKAVDISSLENETFVDPEPVQDEDRPWTAPETKIFRTYSNKSDAWSFGILLHEMYNRGACPREGFMRNLQQMDMAGLPIDSVDKDVASFIASVKKRCWEKCPSDRLTFKELQHYFKQCHIGLF